MTTFFLIPGLETLFAILGAGLLIWLATSVAIAAVGGVFKGSTTGKPIHVKEERSANGKLIVKNAVYTDYDGFYSADIVDVETGENVIHIASRDRKEFDDDINRQLDFWARNPLYKKE